MTGDDSVRTQCSYCGVGCGISVRTTIDQSGAPVIAKVSGDKLHPANAGRLCTKGATHAEMMAAPGRMTTAYHRPERGQAPVPLPVDDAVRETADRLRAILDEHGPDAIALYVSGQMSLEAQYLATKLAKGYLRTKHIEANSRLCMASAGTGYKQSLGADGPPGSYDDFEHADLFFVTGANMADCHPILFLRMADRLKAGAKLIVVDPRRTETAARADLFLQIAPGTDLALLNGLLHLLVADGAIDTDFIAEHTEGWEAMPEFLADYPPERVAELTGLPEADIRTAATMIAEAGEWMSLWTMGLNQSTHGTWNTNALINLHLATGAICRPGSGPFSLTGQPNAMGGREMGYMGPGLPGQRSLLSPADRAFVETAWELPEGTLRTEAGQGTIDMFAGLADGEIKAAWIICTNPVATVANRKTVIAGLEAAELVVVQDAYTETATNSYADLLLPATLWAESDAVMVNSERNVTLLRRSVDPVGEARPDWLLIAQVATAMGFPGFDFTSSAEVFDELRQFTNPATGYDLSGMSYDRLREGPMQWPCNDSDSPRNPIRYRNDGIHQPLHVDADGHTPALAFATPSRRAVFFPRPHLPAAELPDDDYPFLLNTGRLQHQWHTMTKTGKVTKLTKLDPEPFVEVHPDDAARLDLKPGDQLEIASRRGRAVLPVRISDRVRPGDCFAPFHWNDEQGEYLTINAVTNDAVDPTSLQPEFKACAVALRRVGPAAESSTGVPIQQGSPEAGRLPQHAMPAGQPAPPTVHTGQPSADTRQPVGFAPESPAVPGPGHGGPHPLAVMLGLDAGISPLLSEAERVYLGGYLAALQTLPVSGQPVLPATAPLSPQARLWIDGMLAGAYSRGPGTAGESAGSPDTGMPVGGQPFDNPPFGDFSSGGAVANGGPTVDAVPGRPGAVGVSAGGAEPGAGGALSTTVTVLWASQTGNAEELAASVAARLADGGFAPKLLDMDSCEPTALDGDVLVVTSTFGDGGPPDNGADFLARLEDDALRLPRIRYAVFALGDSSYDDFCGHGRTLDTLLSARGAHRLLPRVDSEPDFDDAADQWITDVLTAITPNPDTSPGSAPSGPGSAPSGPDSSAADLGSPSDVGSLADVGSPAGTPTTFGTSSAGSALTGIPSTAGTPRFGSVPPATTFPPAAPLVGSPSADAGNHFGTTLPGSTAPATPGFAPVPTGTWPPGFTATTQHSAIQGAAPQPYPAQAASRPSGRGGASVLDRPQTTPSRRAPAAPFTRQSPVLATLMRNEVLSAPGSPKEVRRFGFDLHKLDAPYEVGDSLGVLPTNCDDLVAEWLAATGLDGRRAVEVDGRELLLTDALRTHFDITKVSNDLLGFIAERNPHPQLAKLLRRDNRNELASYLWDRQAVDVLRDFPVRTDLVDWLGALKKLQPRQYSISSSPLTTPDEVQLTVGVLRYGDPVGDSVRRGGVCSTFLADRAGAEVPIFLQRAPHFRPPLDPTVPMIMVGPGTGIAPFRGFLHERRAVGATGRNWLFFGDQHAAHNFYYRTELEDMFRSGFLTRLDLAFSRDQRERIYVQHRMIEHGAELWSWLCEGAHFYVCGDAARMAKDVDDTLLRIARIHGKLDEAGALAFKKQLVAEKRYVRDVY
ncbi:molybdopterin-dependent oxidoreductase [Nocardia ignorata]|uniref:assimilatory sulfite reductase (NADPH) n=1 Tax=Nocardia ignorata TaxID=145285 RepID=A0A4R6PV48_NOCIG|nr:molybdopterin-dependent oxidoreductase [Nocardia ignorata]TDP42738.1 flavin-dependent oxidoreductase [Nocardia ignorata]